MSSFEPTKPVDATAHDAGPPIASLHGTVTLGTLVSYLFGSREAILTLASHRDTVGLGLIFVLSAAFAREYDGEDLLYEPWRLALPLAASLGTSLLLFGLVSGLAGCRGAGVGRFWPRYWSFLGLYWMTAPLAWLYAIPVERFLSAGDAASANVWLLAIVAVWRVILITRVCAVLYGAAFSDLFYLVMLFADSLAIYLVSLIDVQVFAVMGGVRLTEAESVLATAKLLVNWLGQITWLIWLIGTLVVARRRTPTWSWTPAACSPPRVVSIPVWSLTLASVAAWGVVLPWTQPAQQLRGAVERDLRSGRYREALTTMSAHRRNDFPPHWDPPPRIGFNRERPRILKIVAALSPDNATWVRELFINKLDAALGRHGFPMETLWVEADVSQILACLEGLPEGKAILRDKSELLQRLLSWDTLPADQQQQLEAVVKRLNTEPALEEPHDDRPPQ